MGFGPQRSPVKGVYRSETKSIALSIEGVGPGPEPTGAIYYLAATVIGKQEVPEDLSGGAICGWDQYPAPPTPPQPPDPCEPLPNYCPSLTFPQEHCEFKGTGVYGISTNDLAILARLNPANFPCKVQTASGTDIITIPKFSCDVAYFQQCYEEIVDDDTSWQAGDQYNNCGFGGAAYNHYGWCGLTHTPGVPEIGEDTLRIIPAVASWPIVSISSTGDVITFAGPTYLLEEDAIEITNQPLNNGVYQVFSSDNDGTTIVTYQSLVDEPGGGEVTFLPGIYTESGTYTSVTDLGDGTVAMEVGAHNVQIGWVFTAWNSDNYFEDYYEVLDVTATQIIIEEYYEDESGVWGAGANVYDVATWP